MVSRTCLGARFIDGDPDASFTSHFDESTYLLLGLDWLVLFSSAAIAMSRHHCAAGLISSHIDSHPLMLQYRYNNDTL